MRPAYLMATVTQVRRTGGATKKNRLPPDSMGNRRGAPDQLRGTVGRPRRGRPAPRAASIDTLEMLRHECPNYPPCAPAALVFYRLRVEPFVKGVHDVRAIRLRPSP